MDDHDLGDLDFLLCLSAVAPHGYGGAVEDGVEVDGVGKGFVLPICLLYSLSEWGKGCNYTLFVLIITSVF